MISAVHWLLKDERGIEGFTSWRTDSIYMITFIPILTRTSQTCLIAEGRCPCSWKKIGLLNTLWVGFRLLNDIDLMNSITQYPLKWLYFPELLSCLKHLVAFYISTTYWNQHFGGDILDMILEKNMQRFVLALTSGIDKTSSIFLLLALLLQILFRWESCLGQGLSIFTVSSTSQL